jgi:hypothetical protein
MLRRSAFWASVLFVLSAVTVARGAEDVFHAIPSDAWAFGAVNHPAVTNTKLQKLMTQVGAPSMDLLAMAKAITGVKKGLDEARGAAFVVMPTTKRNEAAPVFLIPVTDYRQFVESWGVKATAKVTEVKILGETFFVGNRGSYAMFAPKEYRQSLEKLLDAKRSIADEYPQLLEWFNENDAVEVATSAGIKMASQTMRKEMRRNRAILAEMGEEAATAASGFDMYAKFLEWAEKDVEIAAIGARVDKQDALHLAARVCFTKDSSLAASLAKASASEKGPLVAMPGGPFVVAGGGACSDALLQEMLGVQVNFMKQSFRTIYDLDDKQADQFLKSILDFPKGTRSISMMIGPGQPGEPILSDMLALYRVENAKKYLEDYEKYLQTLNGIVKDGKAPDAKKFVSVKKTEIGGRPALETEMSLAVAARAKEMEMFGVQDAMSKIFGPGGKYKNLAVAVDDQTVAISFGNSSPLILRVIAALKQPADSLASDADVVKTAALLPSGGQWSGYLSPSGAVGFVKWIIETVVPEGDGRPTIPDFPASPPIGAVVKAVPGQLQAEAVVSSAVLEAIGQYVGLVQSTAHPEVP